MPDNIPAKPDNVPAKPDIIPAKPDNVPAKPDIIPAKPDNIPAKPDIVPAKPDIIPANPDNVSAAADNIPANDDKVSWQPDTFPHWRTGFPGKRTSLKRCVRRMPECSEGLNPKTGVAATEALQPLATSVVGFLRLFACQRPVNGQADRVGL